MTQQKTPDGHYIIVDGRRWRATDPSIPKALESQLVKELMKARRLVKTQGDAARHRVNDAKIALGERGEKWWEEPSGEGLRERLGATMRALLRHRDEDSTICPSEAARAIGKDTWRDLMPLAREVAADLEKEGVLVIMQKGEPVDISTAQGPIRLGHGKNL